MGKVLGSLRLMYSGKGKDMWELPGHPEHLLQVARNTLSTHNVVHLSEVPGKGELINSLSLYMLNVFPSLLSAEQSSTIYRVTKPTIRVTCVSALSSFIGSLLRRSNSLSGAT
jgi:phosphoribosylaminoimidazole-succinocarboxamide synthase